MKHTPWIIAAVLLAVFGLVALAVHAGLLHGFDRATLALVQQNSPRSLDLPFSILSLLGMFEITAPVLALILFFPFRTRESLVLFVLFLLVVLIEWAGKHIVQQPGPPHDLHRSILLVPLPTGSVRTPYSFPSGHAARSAFIIVILLAWVRSTQNATWAKIALGAVILLGEAIMLVSRVSLAEHWPSDVIAGTLLGVALALPAWNRDLDRSRGPL